MPALVDNVGHGGGLGAHAGIGESCNRSVDDFLGFPNPSSRTHSMGNALSAYVRQKIPTDFIKKDRNILITNLHPDLLRTKLRSLGLNSIARHDFKRTVFDGSIKTGRPGFFLAKTETQKDRETVIVSIPSVSNSDYIVHYAALLRFYMAEEHKHTREKISLRMYDGVKENPFKDDILCNFINPGSIFIIGYTKEIMRVMCGDLKIPEVFKESEKYIFHKINIGKTKNDIVFLSSKSSFWGKESSLLIKALHASRPSCVISVAKIATLIEDEVPYESLHAPNVFYLDTETTKKMNVAGGIMDVILKNHPDLKTGPHASIKTPMMLTRQKVQEMKDKGICTLDCEYYHMNSEIDKVNKNLPGDQKPVSFIPIGIPSDRPMGTDGSFREPDINLSNSRQNPTVDIKKENMFIQATTIIEKVFALVS